MLTPFTNQHHISQAHTYIPYRSLLSHQVAPSSSHGYRKEVACWNRTGHQRELYCSLHGSVGGYPVAHTLARKRFARGTEETWYGPVVWAEQIGKDHACLLRYSHSLLISPLLFCRAISYSRTNSLGDTAGKGSYPSRYTRVPSRRISRVMQLHSHSVSGG